MRDAWLLTDSAMPTVDAGVTSPGWARQPWPRDVRCWGPECFALALAGMRFRLSGLSAAQRQALYASYGAYVAAPAADQAWTLETLVLRARRDLLRAQRPADLAVHPLLLARAKDRLRIAGDDLRAELPLEGPAPARLWIADELAIADRTVSENYLRVAAAYGALARGGLLLHSAGVVIDGRAHLFVGTSGAGKTTLARKALAAGLAVLGDDINAAMPAADGWRTFALPFAGELGAHACAPAACYPLASVHLLEPFRETAVLALAHERRLLALIVAAPFVNTDGDRLAALAHNADALARALPMRRLRSRRDDPFAAIAAVLPQEAW